MWQVSRSSAASFPGPSGACAKARRRPSGAALRGGGPFMQALWQRWDPGVILFLTHLVPSGDRSAPSGACERGEACGDGILSVTRRCWGDAMNQGPCGSGPPRWRVWGWGGDTGQEKHRGDVYAVPRGPGGRCAFRSGKGATSERERDPGFKACAGRHRKGRSEFSTERRPKAQSLDDSGRARTCHRHTRGCGRAPKAVGPPAAFEQGALEPRFGQVTPGSWREGGVRVRVRACACVRACA